MKESLRRFWNSNNIKVLLICLVLAIGAVLLGNFIIIMLIGILIGLILAAWLKEG